MKSSTASPSLADASRGAAGAGEGCDDALCMNLLKAFSGLYHGSQHISTTLSQFGKGIRQAVEPILV